VTGSIDSLTPDPMPADACGWLLDGVRRCGRKPVVAKASPEYMKVEQPLLCADHRDALPAEAEVPVVEDGEPTTVTVPVHEAL
jgi:hypothetical protein